MTSLTSCRDATPGRGGARERTLGRVSLGADPGAAGGMAPRTMTERGTAPTLRRGSADYRGLAVRRAEFDGPVPVPDAPPWGVAMKERVAAAARSFHSVWRNQEYLQVLRYLGALESDAASVI